MAKPPVIEDKQIEHLLKATAAYSRVPLRDTALILTLYGTAMSVTELATITVGDYLDAKGNVRVTSAVRVLSRSSSRTASAQEPSARYAAAFHRARSCAG